MNKKERDVLHALCEGDITFSEAASKLGVTEMEIGEMLDDYNWLPSLGKLAELSETEKETLSYIREISQPPTSKVVYARFETQFNDVVTIQNTRSSMGNYIEDTSNKIVPTNIESTFHVSGEIVRPDSIKLSSKEEIVNFIGTNQSINVHFQFKNTQTADTQLWEGLW